MTTPTLLTRRTALTRAAGLGATATFGRRAQAAAPTKITFLTNFFAEAEHGGFYQAKATGLYEQSGLDVTIRMGGPQVNGVQLLTGGVADIIMGYDIQLLSAIEKNLAVTAVAAAFQFDLAGIMTHTDITSLADLKGHRVLIAASSHTTFWPWLKQRYGFTDGMAGIDTFDLQPFLLDKTLAVQGYPSSEPYEAMKRGEKVNFFLFADAGYPPYSNTLIANNSLIEDNPEAVAAFVRCSMLGWVDYFRNPAPANKLIQADSSEELDDQITFAIQTMKKLHVLDRGEAATKGIGTMSDARWKATRDFLVSANLLRPTVDYTKAYTTRFTDGLRIFL